MSSPANPRIRRKRAVHKQGDLSAGPASFRVDPTIAGINRIVVSCYYCGYSPTDVPPGDVCPKCGKHSWERLAVPERLLRKASM